jgi:hypothetical protein
MKAGLQATNHSVHTSVMLQVLTKTRRMRRTKAGVWCRRPSCRHPPHSLTQSSTGHEPCLTSEAALLLLVNPITLQLVGLQQRGG